MSATASKTHVDLQNGIRHARRRLERGLWSSLLLGCGVLVAGQSLAAGADGDERVSMRPLTVEHVRISSKRSFD